MKHVFFSFLLLMFSGSAVASTTVSVKLMTVDVAQKIAQAALEHCEGEGYQVTAVVVSRDARPQAMLRHALASPVTLKIAKKKAFTAANMRMPSSEVPKSIAKAHRKMARMRGGLPIEVGGQFYGGVGVSGATGEIDEECAQAGIDAVAEDLEFEE